MRTLLVLFAILALPALVIAHRQQFLATRQPTLLAKVQAALNDSKFSGIRKEDIHIEYLDITLRGWVPEPSVREEARQRIAAIPGVRCREADNHLLVTPWIHGTLEGERITLSGWLRDESARRDVIRWLQQARPGIWINSDGIRISPHVARVEAPATGSNGEEMPPVFAEVWNAIRGRPALKIVRENDVIRASGALPSAGLRNAVAEAVPGADVSQLRAGPFVRQAHFTHESALPAFLRSLFQSPAVDFFEAGGQSVRARAVATPELEEEWSKLISPLADDGVGTLELWMVSSMFQMPGYKPVSVLVPEMLHELRASLAPVLIHFDSAVHSINASRKSALLGPAAQAILAAGPGARVVVAAHLDTVGDAKLNEDSARRRAAAVISELKARGVPGTQLEPVVLGVSPAPDGSDQSRCVELLVK